MAITPKGQLYKFSEEMKFKPSEAFTNVPALNIAERVPFPVVGIDMTTGKREVDLQQQRTQQPGGMYGQEGAIPSFENYLGVVEPFLARQQYRQLAFQKQVADLEAQQQVALINQLYPTISKAAQEATQRNLAATLAYEEGSPKQRQARMQSAQAGEATMMQAIANQAQAAAAMRGRYQGKNVGIA
jgi:hypothetical protein